MQTEKFEKFFVLGYKKKNMTTLKDTIVTKIKRIMLPFLFQKIKGKNKFLF